MPKARVLFVAHDAYRAGATIFLLNMLRWVQKRDEIRFEVALRNDGEMVSHFETLAPTHVLASLDEPKSWRGRIRQALASLAGKRPRKKRSLNEILAQGHFDLVYLNTITLGDHLETLERSSPPVITHVHELPSAIRRYARGKEGLVAERSARMICVSEVVRNNLQASFPSFAPKAELIYGFTPFKPKPAEERAQLRQRLLGGLGIPPDAWVLGLCGHGDLRKGADLMVPLAALLPATVGSRALHLVWVGVQAPEYPREVAIDDATRAEVAARVHFPGVTNAPLEWIACFDVHLLLSREDPFPLVVMEAASMGVPTVAFAHAGGAEEFIGTDAGLCTPYLNLAVMADEISRLLADEPRLQRYGSTAQKRVLERHSSDVVLPEILRVIDDVVRARKEVA
jgi:glycosyltransferase involved in cell wall biosynthesis